MSGALVEIRRYVAFPGRRAELVDVMDRVVIPFVRARGVEVLASLVVPDDEDAYIWIRSFDDADDRDRAYAAIYEDPEWVDTIGPTVKKLMDVPRAVITTATATA